MPVSYSFDDYSFIVEPEVRDPDSSIFFFFNVALAIWDLKKTVLKAKLTAACCGFIVCLDVKYRIIRTKREGDKWNYTHKVFILFK